MIKHQYTLTLESWSEQIYFRLKLLHLIPLITNRRRPFCVSPVVDAPYSWDNAAKSGKSPAPWDQIFVTIDANQEHERPSIRSMHQLACATFKKS